MLRLILVLTVMLTIVGLPNALQPLLFNQEPRLVILTTDEALHVINPQARDRVEPAQPQSAVTPTAVKLDGLDANRMPSYAELMMEQYAHTQS